jgi:hypothetical protein
MNPLLRPLAAVSDLLVAVAVFLVQLTPLCIAVCCVITLTTGRTVEGCLFGIWATLWVRTK